MNLDKLLKQLRREAAASPKKAALLALAVVVAVYYWAPLVGKAVFQDGGPAPLPASPVAALPAADAAAIPQKELSAGSFPWRQIRQRIRSDPRMASARFETEWPDPFAGPAAFVADAAQTAATPVIGGYPPAAGNESGPREAELVLTSVAIGLARRTATINGETYREGDQISLDSNDMLAHYRVVRISREGVELQNSGRTVFLQLGKPSLAKGDQIQRTGRRRSDQ